MAVFFPEKGCFLTHFMDLQDLRILRGPKMENRSPPGPQLCYLFQAGIPKIGLLGQINGVLASLGDQNSVPHRGNLSWGPQIWPFWPNSRPLISDLGLPDPRSGVSDPKSGLPETQFWVKIGQSRPFWPPGDPHFDLPEVKMTPNLSSGRSKIDHFTQFSSFL